MIKLLYAFTIAALLCTRATTPVLAAWQSVADASASPTFRQLNQDVRISILRAVLEGYKSPLAAEADSFIFYADKYQLDWRLVAAIAGVESTFGKRIPTNSYNAWGWAVYTGKQNGASFESWEKGIATVSEGLRTQYMDMEAVTIEQIGRRYAASRAWPRSVRFFLTKIEKFAPASSHALPVEL